MGMDTIIARAGEKGLDSFRPSSQPQAAPPAPAVAKTDEPVADVFEPARTRLKTRPDPLAPHLTAPMARDEVKLRKPQGNLIEARLSAMLKKHPDAAERAFLAEAILYEIRDPKARYAMTEAFLRRHPGLIPLFALNALARPLEAGWFDLQQDAIGLWREIKAEWRRLTKA